MPRILVKKPIECQKDEIEMFESFVRRGGEVDTEGLQRNIQISEYLIFLVEDDNVLAGVAALKNPNSNHKRRVFTKSKSKVNPDDYKFEIGWIFVDANFRNRRYSRILLQKALELSRNSRIYVTTRENNEQMNRTNLYCGLRRSGEPFTSERGDYNILLYVN